MALIGFVLAGKPPSATSSASSISEWIASNHFSLEVADYLTGVLLLPLTVSASGIRIRLEEAGYRTLGLTAFAGALLIGSLLVIELLVGGTLVLLRTNLSEGTIVALYGLQIYATVALPFLVALFVGSIGLAGLQGAFPRNAGLAGLLVAAFELVAAAANFSATGFFSPEGGAAVAGLRTFPAVGVGGWHCSDCQAKWNSDGQPRFRRLGSQGFQRFETEYVSSSFRGNDAYYFCSAGRKQVFDEDPAKFLTGSRREHKAHSQQAGVT